MNWLNVAADVASIISLVIGIIILRILPQVINMNASSSVGARNRNQTLFGLIVGKSSQIQKNH